MTRVDLNIVAEEESSGVLWRAKRTTKVALQKKETPLETPIRPPPLPYNPQGERIGSPPDPSSRNLGRPITGPWTSVDSVTWRHLYRRLVNLNGVTFIVANKFGLYSRQTLAQ